MIVAADPVALSFAVGFLWVVAIAVVVGLLWMDSRKPQRFPPGPPWQPLVGCYFEIRRLIHKLGILHLVWDELGERFGPIVGLRLGKDRIVLVSGQTAVKRILLDDEFDARPDGFFFRMRSYKKRLGIVFVEGNHFQAQKKFCMMALKKFGLGRKMMEDIIVKEADELVRSLRDKSKETDIFQMENLFDIAVLNSLWALMAGKRFSLSDGNLGELMDLVHESFRLLDMSGGILNQMPVLRFLAPNATGYNRILYVLNRLQSFLMKTIDDHKRNLNREPNDFIDMFLSEMSNKTDSAEKSTFSEEQLIVLLLDLFMAGSETTSNNLSMAMLYMILYPEIQDKVHKIIDSVVPRTRLPTLLDRPGLRYVEAVLFEVQRHATVVPISVPHRSTRDVEFDDYVIPKDTMILINLRSVLMDKDHWGDPENFRPERFQTRDGHLIQSEWFIPFGQGRRRCLGEGLARSSMFILFSAIMQNFHISKVDDEACLTPRDGVTLSPKPFRAILKPRP